MSEMALPLKTDGSIRYLEPQLKGAATGALLLFLLNPGVGFSEEDMAFYTDYSPPTLKRALRKLARFDLAHQIGDRRVWILSAHVRQLDFSDVAEDLGKKIFFPSSSSISSENEKLLPTTTTRASGEKNFSTSDVEAYLLEAGVFPRQAKQLAADPWVTVARADAWRRRLVQDRRVNSVPAVLYTNLRRHLEPGALAREDDDRRRFIEGEYSEFIEY